MVRGYHIQNPSRESYRHANFLLHGQIQMPNRPEGQQQDQNIRKDVDGAGDDEVEVRVYTRAGERRVPRFGHRRALEDDGEDVAGVEGGVETDEDLDEAEDEPAFRGDEDPHQL